MGGAKVKALGLLPQTPKSVSPAAMLDFAHAEVGHLIFCSTKAVVQDLGATAPNPGKGIRFADVGFRLCRGKAIAYGVLLFPVEK